jgi:hypothetical protein
MYKCPSRAVMCKKGLVKRFSEEAIARDGNCNIFPLNFNRHSANVDIMLIICTSLIGELAQGGYSTLVVKQETHTEFHWETFFIYILSRVC